MVYVNLTFNLNLFENVDNLIRLIMLLVKKRIIYIVKNILMKLF